MLRIQTTGAWAEHPLATRCIHIEQQAGEAINQCESKLSHRLSLTHAPVARTRRTGARPLCIKKYFGKTR